VIGASRTAASGGAPALTFLVLFLVGVLGLVRGAFRQRIVLREVAPGLLDAHAGEVPRYAYC